MRGGEWNNFNGSNSNKLSLMKSHWAAYKVGYMGDTAGGNFDCTRSWVKALRSNHSRFNLENVTQLTFYFQAQARLRIYKKWCNPKKHSFKQDLL